MPHVAFGQRHALGHIEVGRIAAVHAAGKAHALQDAVVVLDGGIWLVAQIGALATLLAVGRVFTLGGLAHDAALF